MLCPGGTDPSTARTVSTAGVTPDAGDTVTNADPFVSTLKLTGASFEEVREKVWAKAPAAAVASSTTRCGTPTKFPGGRTVSETAMFCTGGVVLSDRIAIEAVYGVSDGARPEASARTVNCPGLVPDAGSTRSQVAPEVTAVYATGTPPEATDSV